MGVRWAERDIKQTFSCSIGILEWNFGIFGDGIPKSSRVRIKAVLINIFIFREIPAPKLCDKSNGSSIAIHGEFHIFSNFPKWRDILITGIYSIKLFLLTFWDYEINFIASILSISFHQINFINSNQIKSILLISFHQFHFIALFISLYFYHSIFITLILLLYFITLILSIQFYHFILIPALLLLLYFYHITFSTLFLSIVFLPNDYFYHLTILITYLWFIII